MALNEYLKLDADLFIPGHQSITGRETVKKYIHFINFLKDTFLQQHSIGKTRGEIISYCFTLNPFTNTEHTNSLATLKKATLENWYNFWIEKK